MTYLLRRLSSYHHNPIINAHINKIYKRNFSSDVKLNSIDSHPFNRLGISSSLLNNSTFTGTNAQHINQPTPIQSKSIPVLLKQLSSSNKIRWTTLVSATGSGKTLAYLLPLIQTLKEEEKLGQISTKPNKPTALILVPSRELGLQTLSIIKSLTAHNPDWRLRSRLVSSGTKQAAQKRDLTSGIDLLVSTPGRLLRYKEKGLFYSSNLKMIAIDELDTQLDDTFSSEVRQIIGPALRRGTTSIIGVSATLSSGLLDSISGILTHYLGKSTSTNSLHQVISAHISSGLSFSTPNTVIPDPESTNNLLPDHISVDSKDDGAPIAFPLPSHLTHNWILCNSKTKKDAFIDLISTLISDENPQGKILVFTGSIPSARFLDHTINEAAVENDWNLNVVSLHAGLTPTQRAASYESFSTPSSPGKEGFDIAVVTELASLGLDTQEVLTVINFDFPTSIESYIHRAGRAGRTGSSTRALSPQVFSFLRTKTEIGIAKTFISPLSLSIVAKLGDTDTNRAQRFSSPPRALKVWSWSTFRSKLAIAPQELVTSLISYTINAKRVQRALEAGRLGKKETKKGKKSIKGRKF